MINALALIQLTFQNSQKLKPQNEMMRGSKVKDISNLKEESQSSMDVKKYVNLGKIDAVQEQNFDNSQTRLQIIRQVVIKNKTEKLVNVFRAKLLRKKNQIDEGLVDFWDHNEQKRIFSQKGFNYPQNFQNVLDVLCFVSVPLLLVINSLVGVLPEFEHNFRRFPVVIMLRAISFLPNLGRFIYNCTCKGYYSGQYKEYIVDITSDFYSKGRLLFDLISIILQLMCVKGRGQFAVILFFYLSFYALYTGLRSERIEAAYFQSRRAKLFWQLVKIVLFNLLFAQFIATVVLLMANIDPQNSWIVRLDLAESHWHFKYSYAYYWAVTMMTTIGFGDVLPGEANWREVLVTCVLQLLSCVALGYNISAIGNILTRIRQADEAVNRKIIVFEKMMRQDRQKKLQINPMLEKEISNYLEELRVDRGSLEYTERDQLIAELPEHLRRAYYKEANRRIFPSVMFFNRLKPATQEVLAEKLKSSFLNPGECLSHHKIWILQSGDVGLAFWRRGAQVNGQIMEIVHVSERDPTLLLNPQNFLTLQPEKKYELICKNYSMVWSMEKEDLNETLALSNIDQQYYFSLLHKHAYDDNEWEFIACPRCSRDDYKCYHSVYSCPKVTYLPLRSQVRSSLVQDGQCSLERSSLKRRRPAVVKNKAMLSRQRPIQGTKPAKKEKKDTKKQQDNREVTFELPKLDMNRSSTQYRPEKTDRSEKPVEKLKKKGKEAIQIEKLRRILADVLREHETGYRQGYWGLECDQVHDYQFYFPQDNSNRYSGAALDVHPRHYKFDYRQEPQHLTQNFGQNPNTLRSCLTPQVF